MYHLKCENNSWCQTGFHRMYLKDERIKFKMLLPTNVNTFEFSLNDLHWISWIQWIKTKSKSSMITRDTPYLTTDTFLDVDIDISITISGMISVQSGESK